MAVSAEHCLAERYESLEADRWPATLLLHWHLLLAPVQLLPELDPTKPPLLEAYKSNSLNLPQCLVGLCAQPPPLDAKLDFAPIPGLKATQTL